MTLDTAQQAVVFQQLARAELAVGAATAVVHQNRLTGPAAEAIYAAREAIRAAYAALAAETGDTPDPAS